MFLDSHHTVFTFRSLIDLLDVVLAIDTGLQISQASENVWLYSELLLKFGAISFEEYVCKGITHRSSTMIFSTS